MKFFTTIKEYLAGVSAESRRVTWPGKREVWESTRVVIAFIFILAATVLVCDKLIKFVLDVIKGA